MKNIAILGSTGSIGENTLQVIRRYPEKFKVVALSAGADILTLEKQIQEFRPSSVCVKDVVLAKKLSGKVKSGVKIFCGQDGLVELVKDPKIDQVMLAISGSAALLPLVSAIKSGKDIALANKEAMVMAGNIILTLAAKYKINILPVDSEQSAIWQVLRGQKNAPIRFIHLTASGGPLHSVLPSKLSTVTLKDVLRHPRWKMGKKITVDSATLMNKGLEILEAMFLFGVSSEKIKVLIHPEALIHSMVEFGDGVVLAQLSATDMRIPIQYALSYPERWDNNLARLDFYRLKSLNFAKPDLVKFPCLALAYQAARELGTLPAVLNAANEVSVDNFLKQKIKFLDIPRIVEQVMRRHKIITHPDLREILAADAWGKEEARRLSFKIKI